MYNMTPAVEALLFASGDSISVARIAEILDADENEVLSAVNDLIEYYSDNSRGIKIIRIGESVQMVSAQDYSDYVVKLLDERKPSSLSQASLEVLSIVAYFQPVTRAYIESVRGVDSSYTVSSLIDKGLIEVCGSLDVPGRPDLLGTTEAFLRCMGISSLDELPVLPDLSESEGIEELQRKVEELQEKNDTKQYSISEISAV